uniref:Uncharacterized protein n=1 Tax=Lotharella globosa TaxID=91324 RepID=A0A7S3Z9T5_9EUKA|mmetsp:Transcript_20833/g.40260  ORF Transcript_20833/g.40260 Transcript_20833/m.40260 type:complete len:120 (+) Transcript_20833:138-497(+)
MRSVSLIIGHHKIEAEKKDFRLLTRMCVPLERRQRSGAGRGRVIEAIGTITLSMYIGRGRRRRRGRTATATIVRLRRINSVHTWKKYHIMDERGDKERNENKIAFLHQALAILRWMGAK